MTESAEESTPSVMPFMADRPSDIVQVSERRFWAAVAIAALFHLLLLIGFTSAEPRRVGSEEGAERGISISMVSPEELKGYATVDDTAAGRPPPPSRPAQKPEDTPEKPQDEKTPTENKPDQAENAEKQPDPTEAKRQPEPDLDDIRLPTEGLEPDKPKPKPKTSEVKPQSKPEPKKEAPKPQPKKEQTARLDLRVPPSQFTGTPGAGAGVQRPPGITRSGENDEFARGVIRALQRTMPQFRERTLGRVTVRITLDKTGNLVKTEVVRPSSVKGLDQSVVFATHQSSFPLPPVNANKADLVFLVTYVYR